MIKNIMSVSVMYHDQRVGTLTMGNHSCCQFEYDSYELTESSNDELEAVAQLLFMNPGLRIELSSHTDDQGSDKYNDRLSTLRGQAVERWLIARGVAAGRVATVGYGKRKPLVANDSEEHRALNRRVEIKVLEL
jgi:outer membrane protein OmpA-like peptidoglycan-associated protein